MYEIWLALNIVYETVLPLWPWLVAGLGLWLALLWLARSRMSPGAVGAALGIGALAGVIAFLTIPLLDHSSLGDMGYWVDWVTLGGLALAAAGLVAFVAFPVVSWVRKPA